MESCHTINGYKVVFVPVKSNIIYIQSFILSGYMNENRKNLGISHLLEHILTESWTKCNNNCAQYWGKKGIITNAFTSDTIINYYGKGLHQHRKEILEYIVSITTKPKIHTERISVEKKAVKEELDSEMNDPAWKIGFELNKFYYNCYVGLKNVQNFPLQIKNLEHFGKKELENYCNEIYTPANILFVIAGKFNEEDCISDLESLLPKKTCKGSTNMIVNLSKSIESECKLLFIPNEYSKTNEIIVSFFSPNIYPWNKEYALFQIITDILSDGMNSLFMDRLRSQLQLIYTIQVNIVSNVTGTMTIIKTTGDNTQKIIQEIYHVLEDFLKGNWDDGQIERAKDIHMINEDSNCKHTTFWGDFYGFQYINQLYRKSPKIYKYSEITKIIRNATKQDIIDVAKKIFFTPKSLIIYQGQMKIEPIEIFIYT